MKELRDLKDDTRSTAHKRRGARACWSERVEHEKHETPHHKPHICKVLQATSPRYTRHGGDLSGRFFSLISLRRSTPPQNYRVTIPISDSEQYVDNFVGELTF